MTFSGESTPLLASVTLSPKQDVFQGAVVSANVPEKCEPRANDPSSAVGSTTLTAVAKAEQVPSFVANCAINYCFPVWLVSQILIQVSSGQRIHWFTCVTAFTTLVTACLVSTWTVHSQVAGVHKPPPSAGAERDGLLDNAKLVANFFVCYHHLMYYMQTGEYVDTETWLAHDTGLLKYMFRMSGLGISLACFLSGIVMRRPVNAARLDRMVFRLALPTLVWGFVLKPFLHTNLMNTAWTVDILKKSVMDCLAGKTYKEEWYLSALVFWRLLAYCAQPMGAHFVFLAACFMAGGAGYNNLWLPYFNFDSALGHLLLFTAGFMCPYERIRAFLPKDGSGSSTLRALGLIFILIFPWLFSLYEDMTPDNHTPYHTAASYQSAQTGDQKLYWTRRVFKNTLEAFRAAVCVFFVVPKEHYWFTAYGQHTLYMFLFHEIFNFWRNQLMKQLFLPTLTEGGTHGLVLLLLGVYTLAVQGATLHKYGVRMIFQPFLDLTWLRPYLVQSTASAPIDGHSPTEAAAEALLPHPRRVVRPGHLSVQPARGGFIGRAETTEAGSKPKSLLRTIIEPRPFTALPSQVAAHKYYKLILLIGMFSGPLTILFTCEVLLRMKFVTMTADFMSRVVLAPTTLSEYCHWQGEGVNSNWLIVCVFFWISVVVGTVAFMGTLAWKLDRLLQGTKAPPKHRATGLTHVVVVPTYKEPISVLRMTLDSLAAQTYTSTGIHICIAFEFKDPGRDTTFDTLVAEYGNSFASMTKSVHKLCEGEIAGKSSNENHAVRELFKQMVDVDKMDPFKVLLTICDVDSMFAPGFIKQLEYTFVCYPNPEMLLYDGSLNTYRNYWEANWCIRQFESARCHFHFNFCEKVPFPSCQSNYSLTLGFAHNINYWAPDNTPEDLHTTVKAYIHTNGSLTTAPVFSVICNDLVIGWKDRYIQAKRHAWGVTEGMWALVTFPHVSHRLWGSLVAYIIGDQISGTVAVWYLFLLCPGTWDFWFGLDPLARYFFILTWGYAIILKWAAFCAYEIVMWAYVLPSNPAFKKNTAYEWLKLVCMMMLEPVVDPIASFIFDFLPRLDAMQHAYRSVDLAYICAPKDQSQQLATKIGANKAPETFSRGPGEAPFSPMAL